MLLLLGVDLDELELEELDVCDEAVLTELSVDLELDSVDAVDLLLAEDLELDSVEAVDLLLGLVCEELVDEVLDDSVELLLELELELVDADDLVDSDEVLLELVSDEAVEALLPELWVLGVDLLELELVLLLDDDVSVEPELCVLLVELDVSEDDVSDEAVLNELLVELVELDSVEAVD